MLGVDVGIRKSHPQELGFVDQVLVCGLYMSWSVGGFIFYLIEVLGSGLEDLELQGGLVSPFWAFGFGCFKHRFPFLEYADKLC